MKYFEELNKDWKDTDEWVEYSREHRVDINNMMDRYFSNYGFDEVNPGVYIDDRGLEIHQIDNVFYKLYVRGEYIDFQGWNEFYELLPNIIEAEEAKEELQNLIKIKEEWVRLYNKAGLLDIRSDGEILLTADIFFKMFDEYRTEERDCEEYPWRHIHWEEGTKFECITKEEIQ